MQKQERDKLTALVDEADQLEALAEKVQGEDELAAMTALKQLERDYLGWHARALAALPEDLAENFRFEYEGNWIQGRIKQFLQSGRELNSIINEDAVAVGVSPWLYPFNDRFRGPLLDQKRILLSAAERFGADSVIINGMDFLERTFRRLPFALAALSRTVHAQPGMVISNEYDLQRVVHAILHLHFEDVQPEDSGPTVAGSAPRIDFVLPEIRIAFETKMTRESLSLRKLGDDLASDMVRYQGHPDVNAFFALVYDPERRVGNPTGFERTLRSESNSFPMRTLVVQG